MTIYTQDPHRLDSNVTVNVPRRIEIDYNYPKGWFIRIDGKAVGTTVPNGYDYIGDPNPPTLKVTYFKDVSDASDWLLERDLIKTKAYDELDRRVKKASKKKGK